MSFPLFGLTIQRRVKGFYDRCCAQDRECLPFRSFWSKNLFCEVVSGVQTFVLFVFYFVFCFFSLSCFVGLCIWSLAWVFHSWGILDPPWMIAGLYFKPSFQNARHSKCKSNIIMIHNFMIYYCLTKIKKDNNKKQHSIVFQRKIV